MYPTKATQSSTSVNNTNTSQEDIFRQQVVTLLGRCNNDVPTLIKSISRSLSECGRSDVRFELDTTGTVMTIAQSPYHVNAHKTTFQMTLDSIVAEAKKQIAAVTPPKSTTAPSAAAPPAAAGTRRPSTPTAAAPSGTTSAPTPSAAPSPAPPSSTAPPLTMQEAIRLEKAKLEAKRDALTSVLENLPSGASLLNPPKTHNRSSSVFGTSRRSFPSQREGHHHGDHPVVTASPKRVIIAAPRENIYDEHGYPTSKYNGNYHLRRYGGKFPLDGNYGFYRRYGAKGQGAVTSGFHNLPGGHAPDRSIIYS